MKAIWNGKFDFDYAKAQEPTKERYYAERRQQTEWGAFVSFAWSFGSKNENFIYSPKRLLGKRVEHLERIERMQRSAILKDVIATCMDYSKVKIEPNSVIYCDIPYNTFRKHYRIKFDFMKFYDWAAACKFPVYFSEYTCYDKRFELVWEKEVQSRINVRALGEKSLMRTERLFHNGVKI
ncbi:MAG: hypothetical protein LBC87_07275 [Fibromonadaceae bacterium]|nr:hypothetical protein [Fibromonadaceae bacterium]